MLWRFLVKNSDVRIGQLPASTAPGEEAAGEDFVQQPPKSSNWATKNKTSNFHTFPSILKSENMINCKVASCD
jgi:hypothetical protein